MMMMMGEGRHTDPTVHAPPWNLFDDPTESVAFQLPVGNDPYLLGDATMAALQRFLPSNEDGDELDAPVDAYSCDEFRMYEFKVRRCARGRSHDWTECPYAHPGEKARRRDPRKYHYSGTACPDFRKGSCKRGDACEFAHGVFECWLHPARYRTQPCKDGTACRRRVCFFAHTPEQLRVLPQTQSPKAPVESYDGSPLRHHALDAYFTKNMFSSSPTSTLISPPVSPPSDSPPMSPVVRRAPVGASVNEVLASLRQLQLSKAKSAPSSWGLQMGCGLGSPRSPAVRAGGGFSSLPATPTRSSVGGSGWFDRWDGGHVDEPPMERVESGRALRAKMFERLSKESGMERPETGSPAPAMGTPDVGWVSELVM
ncbi:zinc finger CCCH domain-containing protein 35 [Dioscorea cayenensis subsp. rotundata]|uniref:Zinc finger CCCH domain-containing protein 35 n=1 Tax=Dioscorea cayennensis subsp. rotundata TaxID=55577 RepID=A0AB40BFP5_DIOCR|nr:zinc finger CCCH domain-containing protein 35 [Dioscorea cayenensis subsp. rotundata]